MWGLSRVIAAISEVNEKGAFVFCVFIDYLPTSLMNVFGGAALMNDLLVCFHLGLQRIWRLQDGNRS